MRRREERLWKVRVGETRRAGRGRKQEGRLEYRKEGKEGREVVEGKDERTGEEAVV